MNNSNQRNSKMLWLLKPGIKPCLPYESFTKKQTPLSLELYRILNRHFSLMAQADGSVVEAFDRFDKSSRELKGIEASPILLRKYPQHDIFIANIKGQKKEAVTAISEAIAASPHVEKLLSTPDLSELWRTATTPENSIVGGFDPEKQIMVFFGRSALNGAKSIFNFPENPGRYKPRSERTPAFMSSGHVAVSIVEYPQQIDQAISQLAGFRKTCPHSSPQAYCLVSQQVATENPQELELLHQIGIKLILHPRANGFIQSGKRILDIALHTKPSILSARETGVPVKTLAFI